MTISNLRQLLQEAKLELKKSKRKDYYKILAVDKNANEEEIKKAYRKRAMVHHPDRHSGATEAEQKDHEHKFKEVSGMAAANVLFDNNNISRLAKLTPYLAMKRREGCMTVARTLREERVMGSMMWILTAFSKRFSEAVEWEDILGWEVIMACTGEEEEEGVACTSVEVTEEVPRASHSSLANSWQPELCVRV